MSDPHRVSPQPVTHYENFPVASWLCPPRLRVPIAALYHFARTADDLADEGDARPAQRLEQLRTYRDALTAACAGHAIENHGWPAVFGPLRQAIAVHHLPPHLLHALLDAFVQDIEKTRDGTGYPGIAPLLDYCARSANPVGRLLLHLYGVTDPGALAQSDDICTALQLINFWQDPSRDLPRARCYFPQDWCAQHGLNPATLQNAARTPAADALIARCADDARNRMLRGAALVHRLPGRAGWELRLVVQGGVRILDKIGRLKGRVLLVRPRIRPWDAPLLLWRALWM
ncbi:MAG: squalene synthase HpnC [Rhodoferax sp.]